MVFERRRFFRASVAALVAFVVGVLLANVLSRAADFAGTYSGDGLTLVLEADRDTPGDYVGTMTLDGNEALPLRASFDEVKGFNGTFEAEGEQFAFSMKPGEDGEGFLLNSDGADFNLRKQSSPPPRAKNPLAKAGGKREKDQPDRDKTQVGGPPPMPEPVAAGEARVARRVPEAEGEVRLPAFLKPGARITYWVGSASIPGVRSYLVEDDNGNWVDPSTGKRFADSAAVGTGGAGYYQLNVVHATPKLVAVDARSFLIVDVQTGQCSSTTAAGFTGDANNLSDFWINPARLAQLKEGNVNGVRTIRAKYPLNRREYDAVTVQTTLQSGYTRYTYDTETGLLLIGSTSAVGAGVATVDASGTVSAGAGATNLTQSRLLDVRDLKLPWADEPAPQWATKGRKLAYQGTYGTTIPGAGEIPPMGAAVAISIGNVTGGCAIAKMFSRIGYQGAPATESTVDRCFGSGMLTGVWVPPAAFEKLEANQILDDDPVTKFRTTFAGVDGNVVVIAEQGPLESSQYYYDVNSGMLGGVDFTQQQGIGTNRLSVRLAGQE